MYVRSIADPAALRVREIYLRYHVSTRVSSINNQSIEFYNNTIRACMKAEVKVKQLRIHEHTVHVGPCSDLAQFDALVVVVVKPITVMLRTIIQYGYTMSMTY